MKTYPYPKHLFRHFTEDEKAVAALYGSMTSLRRAAEDLSMSHMSVRKFMLEHGCTPRRAGNYTSAEINSLY
jgi:hypothetical protein